MKDGLIPFQHQGESFETYYKLVGKLENRSRTPVIVIHGGPGFSHDYLIPHVDLTGRSYPVVLYDQIGNGRSTHLPDKPPTFWTIDLFIDELVNLLQHLGIQEEFHIIGHSWGGMMASEFVVRRHPKGLKRLVIANSPADVPLRAKAFSELLQNFSQEVRNGVVRGPEVDRQAFWDAIMEVQAVHFCRVQPFPEEFITSFAYKYGENGDRTLDRANITKDWSIVDRLHLVDVPTLVINGRYDFMRDEVVAGYVENIPDSRWVKFEESSHMPFWEEREAYMRVVGDFLGE